MNNTQHAKLIEDFFEVFVDSIVKTLSQSLDTDICTNIQFPFVGASAILDVEDLKDTNVIYKLDYATGNRQGALAVLIPEELIASISDILTGGNGNGAYKGALSEIETNSISKILEKVFKNVENDFKKYYEHDLVFSANATFILKEMPEYAVNTETSAFDFVLKANLSLSEDKKFDIKILMSSSVLDSLMADIGLDGENSVADIKKVTSLSVDNLSDIKINITAELGRARVPIKYALELVRDSMVELDTINNSDIKVFANGVEFAYAQIVAIEDSFGLKITKIISPKERMKNL